jgi:hypothetical protein
MLWNKLNKWRQKLIKFFQTVVLLSKDDKSFFKTGQWKQYGKKWIGNEAPIRPSWRESIRNHLKPQRWCFWVQPKSSRGYQINEESNIKPSSSDLRSPWNRRSLPDSCQNRDAKTVVGWTTVRWRFSDRIRS